MVLYLMHFCKERKIHSVSNNKATIGHIVILKQKNEIQYPVQYYHESSTILSLSCFNFLNLLLRCVISRSLYFDCSMKYLLV